MIVWRLVFALCLFLVSAQAEEATGGRPAGDLPAAADAPAPDERGATGGEQVERKEPATRSSDSICLMVESAARANGLPIEFFARVIWQESRFQPDSVGPLTRNGERAQGIAQFMPGTAAERRLLDPFDPVQALPKSAEFLRELRDEFGNWGLAAAAYNAGPQRVRDFLASSRGLPAETRHYVLAITGRSVEDWAANRPDDRAVGKAPDTSSCRTLIALLKQAPNRFVDELERRVRVGAMLPWGVQLNAGFSRARVLSAYASLEKRFSAVLDGHDPVILSTMLRSRGTRAFYQVRVGAPTRSGANDLCSRIQRAGGACMVLRNGRGAG